MEKSKKVALNRQRRHRHIRKKVIGTAQRPRLVVYRSLKHIYAQLVDDISQKSLLGVSTLTPQVREKIRTTKGKCEKSKEVGRFLAMMAKAKGIEKVVF
ncbi:MAG TPA: 50S ribosomal protein L18, partial [Firmicutes bacterium]|nr:50S ribosomal protein L18 [Bacillota bacterium]